MYCEQCGKKLEDDALFCDSCGAKVTTLGDTAVQKKETDEELYNELFEKTGSFGTRWEMCAEIARLRKMGTGILLYDTTNCHSTGKFKMTLFKFWMNAKKRGTLYCMIDVADNDLEHPLKLDEMLDIICRIYSIEIPDNLLLIGDRTVFPSIEWENNSCDSDAYVHSDMPYITLSTISPWEMDLKNDLTFFAPVGRIPAVPENDFDDACAYINNILSLDVVDETEKDCMGMSAYQWEKLSNSIFKKLTKNKLLLSPDDKSDELNLSEFEKHNIYYFNLHGASTTNVWYGQKDNDYPEAVKTEYFTPHKSLYVIGVEACYGAKPNISSKCSILNTALKTGCVSFLGSSEIAYGCSVAPGSCADVLVGEFLVQVENGNSMGEAYLNGIDMLMSSAENMDDAEIKTFAEFALYGDPSVVFVKTSKKSPGYKNLRHADKFTTKQITVPMPNVRQATQLQLMETSNNMVKRINKMLSDSYPEFVDATIKTYSLNETSDTVSVIEKSTDNFINTLRIYFDKKGKIAKVYQSK